MPPKVIYARAADILGKSVDNAKGDCALYGAAAGTVRREILQRFGLIWKMCRAACGKRRMPSPGEVAAPVPAAIPFGGE